MDMTWREQWSIGNAVIDSDHQKLVGLINYIACVTKAKDGFELSRALKLFKDCMNSHSINEEQFAQALDFPFAAHKLAHQNIQAEINFTGTDFARYEREKNSMATIFIMEHYAQFLWDCLIKHITEEDMLMKPVLQARPYDFMIDEVLAVEH
jgi:hemerythrin-like metal-binding protein